MVSAGGLVEAETPVEAEADPDEEEEGEVPEVVEVVEVEVVVEMKFAMMPMSRIEMKSWRRRVKRKKRATGGAL